MIEKGKGYDQTLKNNDNNLILHDDINRTCMCYSFGIHLKNAFSYFVNYPSNTYEYIGIFLKINKKKTKKRWKCWSLKKFQKIVENISNKKGKKSLTITGQISYLKDGPYYGIFEINDTSILYFIKTLEDQQKWKRKNNNLVVEIQFRF